MSRLHSITVWPSKAYTADPDPSVFPVMKNEAYRGVIIYLDISVYTAGTATPKVQVKDPESGNWIDLAGAEFAAKSATGTSMLTIYPGIAESANVSVSDVLPEEWRIDPVLASSPDMTFSIGATYIP